MPWGKHQARAVSLPAAVADVKDTSGAGKGSLAVHSEAVCPSPRRAGTGTR